MPVLLLAGRAVLSVAFSLLAVLLVVLPAKSDETTPEQDPLPPVTVGHAAAHPDKRGRQQRHGQRRYRGSCR